MTRALIAVEGVSVLFPLYHGNARSLKKMVVAAASGRLGSDQRHRVVVEALRELDFLKTLFGGQFDPNQYRMLIFGFAMVLMMIWKPRGLISTRTPSIFLKQRKAIAGDLVKEGHG